ncbi:hypothetical protein T4B_13206 [Trichinella pseudospiralis]|uniref:Uncharacterized protein n=1 Tax=Trichinella pseudospiralis TaxID=6337 RepID=A0A0V1J241_TRIPS|nr:hypothetical protein T4A_12449 [Trichinella pseudospiralis]KRZ29052.1 hypothetical protein T4B_13206 [Trichinella pseudospiralis]KRZ38237.1 hypothetical protein T4C_10629 [Trichinella pseudospiralis]
MSIPVEICISQQQMMTISFYSSTRNKVHNVPLDRCIIFYLKTRNLVSFISQRCCSKTEIMSPAQGTFVTAESSSHTFCQICAREKVKHYQNIGIGLFHELAKPLYTTLD